MLSRIETFLKVAAIAGVALLTGGCSTVAFGSVFHPDGSATHSITVMFERGGLIDSDARRLERQLNVALERAEAEGHSSERINTMTQTGMRVSTTTREVLDTGAVLNSLYNSLTREGAGPIAPFVGGFDRESTAVGGTRFNVELAVDGDVLFRSVQDVSPGHRQLATREGVDEVVHFIYSVTMPGQVRSADGETVGRSVVRWQIPLEGITTMSATSNQSQDSPWILIGATILGSLVLVVTVAATVAWVLIHQRSRGRSLIVVPSTGATSEVSEFPAADMSATVQDVGSSLARVVDHVIGGQSDVDGRDEERDNGGFTSSREMVDGSQP